MSLSRVKQFMILRQFGAKRLEKILATEAAIQKNRDVIFALGMLLESQNISATTTSIIQKVNGKTQRISLLEVIRGAEQSLNELEELNHE